MRSIKRYLPPFLLGFIALSWQILLMREFAAHFYGNEIIFGLLLGAWLFWTGTGSILGTRLRFTEQRFTLLYVVTLLLFPLCLLTLRFSRFILHMLPGETTGMLPALCFALALCFFLCLPLGILFVWNTHALQGDLARVYLSEALGSALAGFILYFLLIPLLSNWQATAILGCLITGLLFFCLPACRARLFLIPSLLIMLGFGLMDFPSQQSYWRPYNLIASHDTRYGKLQLIQSQEQFSLYNNSAMVYTYPDPASAEEAVHFALLQRPEAKHILLIGGGVAGGIAEILKYPATQVDYVELDPEIIQFALNYLPLAETQALQNDRVNIYFTDGRAFLSSTDKLYDIILLNLPDPSTAQINRFFTQEFFLQTKQSLTSSGILSLRVSSAENYISEELQGYLASLHATLAEVFADIDIFPGSNNIFLASRKLPRISTTTLIDRINEYALDNIYVSPQLLSARLSPLRIKSLQAAIRAGPAVVNRDLRPISYYFNAMIWATQFQGLEARLIEFFSGLGRRWLLDLPLLLFVSALIFFGWKAKRASFLLTPLVLLGTTTITAEILVIFAFQTTKGYLYQGLALLFSVFMLGIVLGALRSMKRKKPSFRSLILLQVLFLGLLLFLWVILLYPPGSLLYVLFLFLLGFLGGDLFVIANALFLKQTNNYGMGYGLDLLGGFLGALGTSSILVPLFGIPTVIGYLFMANIFCFAFLLWGKYRLRA